MEMDSLLDQIVMVNMKNVMTDRKTVRVHQHVQSHVKVDEVEEDHHVEIIFLNMEKCVINDQMDES